MLGSFALGVIGLLLNASLSTAAERATVNGKVTDAAGKPLEHAAVMVYSAGVRTGYSTFCPTCYVDCGRHVFTDSDGGFHITGLSPELIFNLLVMKEGFAAQFVNKVDPSKGPAETAALKVRTPPADVSQCVRGRVVDAHGDPVADAVVEQQGISLRGPDGRIGTMYGGTEGWIDAISVSDQQGEFELAYGKPAIQITINISPRGMASKLFTVSTGAERKTFTVTAGATVKGRLVRDGKPVTNAELAISTHSRASGSILPDMRIGTREDGTFAITNVSPGRIWYLYGTMNSLAEQGLAAQSQLLETKDDGEVVDLGDVEVRPAFTLRGKVALTDGKMLPAGTSVFLGKDGMSDTQTVVLDGDGGFEFKGLESGVYSLGPSVRDYRVQGGGFAQEVLVKRNVDHLVVMLEPAKRR